MVVLVLVDVSKQLANSPVGEEKARHKRSMSAIDALSQAEVTAEIRPRGEGWAFHVPSKRPRMYFLSSSQEEGGDDIECGKESLQNHLSAGKARRTGVASLHTHAGIPKSTIFCSETHGLAPAHSTPSMICKTHQTASAVTQLRGPNEQTDGSHDGHSSTHNTFIHSSSCE